MSGCKTEETFDCILLFSFLRDTYMSYLDPTIDYSNFKNCDMVIEAVFEDINIKHKVIKEVEAVSSFLSSSIVLNSASKLSHLF